MPAVLFLVAGSDRSDSGNDWSPAPLYESSESSPSVARVLVVDDEPTVRRMLARLLSEAGYEVVEATDGARALGAAMQSEAKFDLVITDIKMPGMDGRELGRHLNAALPGLPVLYISGYTSVPGGGLGDSGADAPFVRKPFDPDDLLRKVEAMLRDQAS